MLAPPTMGLALSTCLRPVTYRHIPRTRIRSDLIDPTTLAGYIKAACFKQGATLASLAPRLGMRPDSLRARLSKSRGKRSLQPWQVTVLAESLDIDIATLHRLAARHEGWHV